MRIVRVAVVAASLLLLQGCAAAALSIAGLVGNLGIDHVLEGIAYKTFTAPIETLRLAALRTLKRMDFTVTEEERRDNGWRIVAKAPDRDIDIELETITRRATRMRVVVEQSNLFKDSATGSEIITQTVATLNDATERL